MKITTREALERIAANREAMRARDERVAKKHHADEQAYLKRFRQALKDAGKWTYEDAKRYEWAPTRLLGDDYRRARPPFCPDRAERLADDAVRHLRLYGFDMKIDVNTKVHRPVWLALTWSDEPTVSGTVC